MSTKTLILDQDCDEKRFQCGIWYFLTISLCEDYVPTEAMKLKLRKIFPICYVVGETGDSDHPKKHLHLVGNTVTRQDSVVRSIKTQLIKDGCDIDDKYSVKVIGTPKPEYELGYIQKEKDYVVYISQEISDVTLQNGKDWYDSMPKRKRKEDRGTFNLNTFVEEMQQKCRNRDDIRVYLKYAKQEGLLRFSDFQKLNLDKLCQWITDDYDVDKRIR